MPEEAVRSSDTRLWAPIRAVAGLLRFWAHALAHLWHHLPAALAVAALVAVGHGYFHLFDAIDGYAFLGIGNLSAVDSIGNPAETATVAVIEIDQQSHEDFYQERSPLNRCELARDLRAVYELAPKLLVIDLDLSPSLKKADSDLDKRNAEDCENTLYELIEEHKGATKTVLMAPFPVIDEDARGRTETWQDRMRAAEVEFGDATLPIRYGLVTEVDCDADSLTAVAFRQFPPKQPSSTCRNTNGRHETFLINPHQYVTGLHAITVSDLPFRRGGIGADLPRLPVVFFGGTYGDGDTFLTPLGRMYGVEVHAAAYMSLVEPTSKVAHLIGFGLEVILGVIFGGIITFCWRRYYAWRFSDSALKRQLSPAFVFILGAGFVCLIVLATWGSLWLLSRKGYWLSPIPIAIGMLIESFFAAAVQEAVKEGHSQRQAVVRRLADAYEEGATRFGEAIEKETKQQPPDVPELREQLRRFFVGDFVRLYEKGERGAAAALAIRRLAFLALLVFALMVVLHLEDSGL